MTPSLRPQTTPADLPAPADGRALGWLAAVNAFTLALALWQDWPLALLLWPYWAQSVIIGAFSYRRIMSLEQFSTEGFRINRQAVEPTAATRRATAVFFAVHYGFFHFVYAVFLGALQPLAAQDWAWVALASFAFFLNHRQSFGRFLAADRRGSPNVGTLMILPYLRVVPMHLMIIFGVGMLEGGPLALLLFGVLKTAADCAMHVAEHRILAGAAVAAR
jgi:cation transport ATPase